MRAVDRQLAAIAVPSYEATKMPDQVVDAVTARAIQVDAARSRALFAWIILKDQANYPGKFVARLAFEHPTIYVMVADTLAEVQAMLPLGLVHSMRDNADPAEVVEIWFGPEA